MFCFFDCVFGRIATMPDRLACRPDTIFHRISDPRPNLRDLAKRILVLSGAQTFRVAICNYLPAAACLLVALVAAFFRRRERAALVGAIGCA